MPGPDGVRHWLRQGGDMIVAAAGLCVAVVLGLTLFALDQSGYRRSAENAVRAALGEPGLTFETRSFRNQPGFGEVMVCGEVSGAPERRFAVVFRELGRREDLRRVEKMRGQLPTRHLAIADGAPPERWEDLKLTRMCEVLE